MPTLIKHQRLQPVTPVAPGTPEAPVTPEPEIPALATFLASPHSSCVQLAPADNPATLLPYLQQLELICLEFPTFQDGRAFSQALLLRQQRYSGELRAVGDILPDICYHLYQCGFDSFLIPDHYPAEDALHCIQAIPHPYQSTQRTPQPWFRRNPATTG